MTEMLALKDNWLEAGDGGALLQTNMAMTVTGIQDNISVTSGCYQPAQTYGCGQTYGYGYPWAYPVYVSSPTRPIKLTLSEIDRLRKAAKADDKLKTILAKFTSQIEITVDFE